MFWNVDSPIWSLRSVFSLHIVVGRWSSGDHVPGLPHPSCHPLVACEICAITAVREYSTMIWSATTYYQFSFFVSPCLWWKNTISRESERTFGRSILFVGTYGFGIVLRILLILILLEITCAIEMIAYTSATTSWLEEYDSFNRRMKEMYAPKQHKQQ
jgi:hypothetical protein